MCELFVYEDRLKLFAGLLLVYPLHTQIVLCGYNVDMQSVRAGLVKSLLEVETLHAFATGKYDKLTTPN